MDTEVETPPEFLELQKEEVHLGKDKNEAQNFVKNIRCKPFETYN
jgi:hypothetical protein